MATMDKVAFLGLGTMGAAMAANLARAGFAVTAWNKLLTCPGTVTASQATTIAKGFMTAFECTSNAPEATSSGKC